MGSMYRRSIKPERIPSVPSIQTKNQTVLITNPEKKGFSSQAKRFPTTLYSNENPGPGTYGWMSTAELYSPSFSKKGTTGFILSKSARKAPSYIPGPNTYNLPSSLMSKCDFNVGVSRMFQLPIAVQPEFPKNITPAPNQYDVSRVNRERISSMVGTSNFLSKTKRELHIPHKDVPSPGHYDVSSSFIGKSPKAVLSPFKSKTQRILLPANKQSPGPGAYNLYQTQAPMKRLIQQRGPYLALSAPPVIVPKDPPLPGPGQYNLRVEDHQCKNPKLSAAFASRTERAFHNSQADSYPGPCDYSI